MLTDEINGDTIQLQTKQITNKTKTKGRKTKMKTYVYFEEIDEDNYETIDIFAGNACEIEELYKELENDSFVYPLYKDSPKFNANKNYGIIINGNGYFHVITEDVLKEYLFDAYEKRETV